MSQFLCAYCPGLVDPNGDDAVVVREAGVGKPARYAHRLCSVEARKPIETDFKEDDE